MSSGPRVLANLTFSIESDAIATTSALNLHAAAKGVVTALFCSDASEVILNPVPTKAATDSADGSVTMTEHTSVITRDVNGGNTPFPTSKSVTFGSTYGVLPAPTRTGYTFTGWQLNGANVTSASTVATAADHTLIETWTDMNEAPTDIALTAASIPENRPTNTAVGTCVTADADASDSFNYSLVGGTGSIDNASFSMSGGQFLAGVSGDRLAFKVKAWDGSLASSAVAQVVGRRGGVVVAGRIDRPGHAEDHGVRPTAFPGETRPTRRRRAANV